MLNIERLIGIGLIDCFGGSSPAVQPAPKMPSSSDAEVEAARERERKLARLRKGRRSTILTPLSDESGGSKTLLGQ